MESTHDDWFEVFEHRLFGATTEQMQRFAVACCRRVRYLMDPIQQRAVGCAEAFLNSRMTEAELVVALQPIRDVPREDSQRWDVSSQLNTAIDALGNSTLATTASMHYSVAWVASCVTEAVASRAASHGTPEWDAVRWREERALTDLSDSFGASDFPPLAKEDPFDESDEDMAAWVRQVFRAHQARDTKAIHLMMGHFEYFLYRLLPRHLSASGAPWNGLSRTFDGLPMTPEFSAPGRMRLRGEAYSVNGSDWGAASYDPIDIDIELCPGTGTFRGYVVRFGDHRPAEERVSGSATPGGPVGGWLFTVERRRAERSH